MGVGQMIGDIAGAEIQSSSAQNINQQQMQFNAQQAQINRDWETQMSDTAMQRRVADLNAAGINPLLAIQQGGASSPMAGAASAGQLQNPGAAWGAVGGDIGASAQGIAQRLQQAQTKQAEAQAGLMTAQTPSPSPSRQDPTTGEVTAVAFPGHELGDANLAQIQSTTGVNEQQALQIKANTDLIGQSIKQVGADATLKAAQASLAGANEAVIRGTLQSVIQTAKQEASMGKARADIMGDPTWGPLIIGLQALLPSVTSAIGAAKGTSMLPGVSTRLP